MQEFNYGAPPQNSVNAGAFITRPQTFDQYLAENEFPRVEDEALNSELISRHQQITPTEKETETINSLVTRTKQALENVVATDSLNPLKIEEVREVGSFKKGTMLSRHNVGDVVIMFKGLPKPEDMKKLADQVVEHLKSGVHQNDVFGVVPREFGCEIAGTQAVIRLLAAIPGDQIANLEPDVHCKTEVIQQNLAALRHSFWFEHSASQPNIKMLVRLVKDIKKRCKGLAALDVYTIELLSHYSVICTYDRIPLPLSLAFRRFFQLIASGFLLHTSIAVADPCDPTRRINYGFDLAEAHSSLHVCLFTIQFDRLLGTKLAHVDIGSENETGTNLSIAPLKEAYNKETIVNIPPVESFSKVAA
ncbi:hypothetical protein M3Y97_00078800 [Aphelenchoides bicaudatus]|nr:hypothetical protein M3Y97_00078800 [Aphelenchoides bicaudatus]